MPQDSQGRYVPDNEPLAAGAVASAARTTSGTGSSFDTANINAVNGTLVVTAASGTSPTLDLILETTADGTNYYTATTTQAAFPQQTTTTTGVSRIIGDLGTLSRWKWTIAGTTPSFTFSVSTTVDR